MSELSVGLLRREEQALTPWRNAGGVTRELASGTVDGQLLWRVSIARIDEPGAFSAWPGLHRTLMLLTGDQVVLTVAGNDHAVLRGQTSEFSGSAEVLCALPGGPVEVLNVMTRRGTPPVELHVHDLREGGVELSPGDLAVLLEGEAAVRLAAHPTGDALPVSSLDVLLPVSSGDRVLEGVGQVVVVHRT